MTSPRDVLACRAMTRRKGKILVTGGLGNLGLSTLSYLMREDFDVRFLDLPTRANRARAMRLPRGVERAFGDVTNAKDVADAVHGVTGIVHLAAPPPADVGALRRARAPRERRWHHAPRGGCAHREDARSLRARVFVHRLRAGRCGRAAREGDRPDHRHGQLHAQQGRGRGDRPRRGTRPPTIMRVGVAIEAPAVRPIRSSCDSSSRSHPTIRSSSCTARTSRSRSRTPVAREAAHGGTWNVGGGPSCRVTQRDLFRALERTMRIDPRFPPKRSDVRRTTRV
jgi:hypothetical protein